MYPRPPWLPALHRAYQSGLWGKSAERLGGELGSSWHTESPSGWKCTVTSQILCLSGECGPSPAQRAFFSWRPSGLRMPPTEPPNIHSSGGKQDREWEQRPLSLSRCPALTPSFPSAWTLYSSSSAVPTLGTCDLAISLLAGRGGSVVESSGGGL